MKENTKKRTVTVEVNIGKPKSKFATWWDKHGITTLHILGMLFASWGIWVGWTNNYKLVLAINSVALGLNIEGILAHRLIVRQWKLIDEVMASYDRAIKFVIEIHDALEKAEAKSKPRKKRKV